MLQNVNSATDAAYGSCLLNSDLLSCRAMYWRQAGIKRRGLGVDVDGADAAHESILTTDIVPRTTLPAALIATL